MGEILRAVYTESCVNHLPAVYTARAFVAAGAPTESGYFYVEAKADKHFLVMSLIAFRTGVNGGATPSNLGSLEVEDLKNGRQWSRRMVQTSIIGGNLAGVFTLPEYLVINPNENIRFKAYFDDLIGSPSNYNINLNGIEYGMPDNG